VLHVFAALAGFIREPIAEGTLEGAGRRRAAHVNRRSARIQASWMPAVSKNIGLFCV